jgi:hypothetical protein
MKDENPQLTALIAAMGRFASTTKNDTLSVEVARVAQRLQHVNKPFERPLNARERAIIRPFLAQQAAEQEVA